MGLILPVLPVGLEMGLVMVKEKEFGMVSVLVTVTVKVMGVMSREMRV